MSRALWNQRLKGRQFGTFAIISYPVSTLRRITRIAKQAGMGVWPHFSANLTHFDPTLRYRSKGPEYFAADVGDVIWPKLFRRQVKEYVSKLNALFTGSFAEFLAKQDDAWMTVPSYVVNPEQKKPKKNSPNSNLRALAAAGQVFKNMPSELVFFEQPSKLVSMHVHLYKSEGLAVLLLRHWDTYDAELKADLL